MKRILVALIVTSMVAFNSLAFAAEEGTTVDAGITPDSILYTADKLFEDIQLAFASNTEEEAGLLLQFAQERLAEAKEMTEQEKVQFVETAVKDYMAILEQAQDAVLEVTVDENQDQEVAEDLIEELENTAEASEEVAEGLSEEQQQDLEEAAQQVSFTANVVKNVDVEIVTALREQGFGFGQIAHVVVLAEKSGKTVEEIASLVKEDKRGIGEVAKELGVNPSEMKPKSLKAAEAETPVDTEENASVIDSAQQTISAAISSSIETKPAAKAESVKKATEESVKPEHSNADVKVPEEKKAEDTKLQDINAEDTKVQQPASTGKTDTAEAPKQNGIKKEDRKINDSSDTDTSKSEGTKGGNSSRGGNGKK